MDAVTAIGLAGSIIQFVTFASSLLSKTSEIHNSLTGRAADLTNLLTVHEHLQSFSTKLASQEQIANHQAAGASHAGDSLEFNALKAILQSSRIDCDRILKLIESLDVSDKPHRRWRSFKAALELVWKREEIEELEKRLQRAQSAVTLHVCSLTSLYHKNYSDSFNKLSNACSRYLIKNERTITSIFEILRGMERRYLPREHDGASLAIEKVPVVGQVDVEVLSRQLSKLELTATSIERQQAIIRSLEFKSRPMRHESIAEAHARTFGWAYQPKRSTSHGQLLSWLWTGSGIFWVSGKPGSGKSTFMKHIADDRRTQHILEGWARPKGVAIASHYFWISGTDMQKSRQGLLQEIIMQIFRQQPDLITSKPVSAALGERTSGQAPWSISELTAVLKILPQPELGVKICIFIDGLDEYSGDHMEFCQDLLQLASSNDIKICVSSRPWNVFADAFQDCPTIRIHELTEPDIQSYVRSRMSEHVRWAQLRDQPRSGDNLIDQVTQRAQGVFLWVFLVTKLLREGLTNDDSPAELRKRLEQFPVDLGPFFKQMLDSVEPFYHQKMAGALQMAVTAGKPLQYVFYLYHEEEYDDENYALKMNPRRHIVHQHEFIRRHHRVVRRVNGYCKGLLQVGKARVSFLHRTVEDFLKTREMGDYLLAKMSPTYIPRVSILRAILAFIKDVGYTILRTSASYLHTEGDKEFIQLTAKGALDLAITLEEENANHHNTTDGLLDEFGRSMSMLDLRCWRVFPPEMSDWSAPKLFLAALIKIGAVPYLERKVTRDAHYLKEFDIQPLSVWALLMTMRTPYDKAHDSLENLLQLSEGPNEKEIGFVLETVGATWTPWTIYVSRLLTGHGVSLCRSFPTSKGKLLTFIKYGADRNAGIFRHKEGNTLVYSRAWVDFLFFCLNPVFPEAIWGSFHPVLDAFLDGDIDMSSPVFIPISGRTEYVYEAFLSALEQRIESLKNYRRGHRPRTGAPSDDREPESEPVCSMPYPVNLEQLPEWETVTTKLIIRSIGSDWPVEKMWPRIGKIFGPRAEHSMRTQYTYQCHVAASERNTTVTKRDFGSTGLEFMSEAEGPAKMLKKTRL